VEGSTGALAMSLAGPDRALSDDVDAGRRCIGQQQCCDAKVIDRDSVARS